MCGIAGFVGSRGEDLEGRLRAALGALHHRGPDDQGLIIDGAMGVGMTRLAIVGIETGQQPIISEDGRTVIVGNGEIYNAHVLRRELEGRSHRFRGDSDIEVALHLFEERGCDAFRQLDGMFALAIIDTEQQEMVVARDRLGIKPLCIATTPRGTIIASEPAGIRAALLDDELDVFEIDESALRDYLAMGYVPAPRSFYRGIRKLTPGHFARITPSGYREEAYWTLPEFTRESRSEEEWVEELRALLTDAVHQRTLGDVRPGAFLSGGLDSGTIVALLSQSPAGPVPCFTLGFEEQSHDELQAASDTAGEFGCPHRHEILPSPTSDELETLFAHVGEPFADVSLLPTHRVARLAAREVKFVLSGDGGDELFLGYSWLQREVALRRLPRAVQATARWLRPILQPGQRVRRGSIVGKALRVAGDLASPIAVSFLRRRSLASPWLAVDLVHPRFQSRRHRTPLELHCRRWQGDPLELIVDLDRRFYLAGDILEKVDRATMMHSLEARVPFLDHRLVELAARIPVETHLGPGGRGKHILRRAMQQILPPGHFRRPKRGFGIPVDAWLRGQLAEYARDSLLCPEFRQLDLLDPEVTESLLREHIDGRARHGHLIWGLLSLSCVVRANRVPVPG